MRRGLRVGQRRERVVVDDDEVGGIGPRYRSSATTAATGSPAKRTTSVASRGRRMPSGSMGSVWAIGGSSRSALVNTPSTPGCREASSVSMPTIRACGYDERT